MRPNAWVIAGVVACAATAAAVGCEPLGGLVADEPEAGVDASEGGTADDAANDAPDDQTPPRLWEGPGRAFFFEGGTPASCPAARVPAAQLFAGVNAGRAVCTKCTCGPPVPSCFAAIAVYSSATCGVAAHCGNININGPGACPSYTAAPGCGAYLRYAEDFPVSGQSRCEPSGDGGIMPPSDADVPSWSDGVTLCELEGGAAPSCLWRAGTGFDCPADHPVKRAFYERYADSRACLCDCAPGPRVECEGGTGNWHSGAACTAITRPYLRNVCTPKPAGADGGTWSVDFASVRMLSDGGCAAMGAAVGDVRGQNAVTVCCTE